MRETERILDQLERSYHKDAWHGSAVREVLQDVTADQAAAKPLASAHSIWEIVLHMAAWKRYVHETLGGQEMKMPDDVDWPSVTEVSEAGWQAALKRLDEEHVALTHSVRRLEDTRLDTPVTRLGVTVYRLLHGVVQHDLYHAGQIRLLAKHG